MRTIGASTSSAAPPTSNASSTSESCAVTVTPRILGALEASGPGSERRRRAPPLAMPCLDHGHVLRLGALLTLDAVELDLRSLGERPEALAVDGAVMDEQVLAARVRGDEAIPLRIVEPLDGSGCHVCNTSPAISRNGQRKRRRRN